MTAPHDVPGGRPKTGPVARVLLVLLAGYQKFVSPLLGPRCRFEPSCSSYAVEAVRVHGALWGSWLAGRRLLRCHPFHPGGYDPVPSSPTRPRPRRARADAPPPGPPPRSTGARPC